MLVKKNWNVAGGLIYFEKIIDFLSNIKDFYNIRENFIKTVYDSHPGLIWNGGRFIPPFPFSVEESIRRVHFYNDLGIGFNFSFSNRLLKKEHLSDEDCNWVLKKCENEMNGVIVASEMLREHIRKKYPKYRLIASIGFNRTDEEFYKEARERYDIVTLHPDMNRNYEFIKKLDTSRLEVLVNEHCAAGCPFRIEHSNYISKIILKKQQYFLKDNEHTRGNCLAVERGYKRNNGIVVNLKELNKLFMIGIKHFKIQGREHSFEKVLYGALTKYVVQDTIRSICGTNE